ncbi:LysM peptidoglycan-binding domain-containing protein [Flavobacterium sp.]|uniref:LysM peptidoglycan-binding domain-containing protein n=1 Tax=Flavobacterium sp. TaxID=239 RepID=UPI002B4ABB7D|nr:LysM peptidoglycan-binding domain-containing protein [Flavobacterium sp.]HLP65403.1 LysM peptidoglycan-binding domain-containing protein [Flavobacterium sp.]
MKRFFSIFFLVFLQSILAQQTNHTVQEGETISKIAQKYKVTPFDIYKLNPDAQTGVKPGMVLAIPKSVAQDGTIETKAVEVKPVVTKPTETKPAAATSSQKTHTVKAKESVYGISKQYGITIDELEKNNPILKETGLQPGQVLVIKKGANAVKPAPVVKPVASNSSGIITHQVQPKETKYGIATKYGITVEELERQNPDVVDNLPIGFVLKINKNGKATTPSEPEKPKEVKQVAAKPLFNYSVKDGDTFYSLTKSLGLTQEELTKLNPELSDGLKEGMMLKVPVDLSNMSSPSKASTNLVNSISKKDKKHLVLLIPFNVSKIEMDTVKTLNSKFKDDKFLNMTLDFYSGVMMAIDSAKVLGLNVDVSIFDSEETKTTTSALSTLQNKASNADAVIGPFFQANVEKVAQSLESKKVPVISPLSKEVATSYANLYNSMPSEYAQKKAIFDYMNGKNGNVIALVDADKTNSKAFISEYEKNVKWVGLSSKGTFVSDSIKKHFVKDRLNFVVMESEKYETIQTTLTAINSSLKEYSAQLVVLETNEMLDFEEISLNSLVKSKLTYPSLYRENESNEAIQFEKAYRIKNKVLPNQFATRGFDLTFDTMLRLSQDKSFEETVLNAASEQVESKFDYIKNSNGGYLNKGVYVLTYQSDLTIKEAQ